MPNWEGIVVGSRLKFLLPMVAFIVTCSPGSQTSDVAKRRNVVIIVSDALRGDVLGCYGGEARTPNIDGLAENGVLFENAYTNSAWTGPSSVNMFTGNYATAYEWSPYSNTVKIHVPNREVELCEVLQENGYATIAMVENVHAVMHNNLQGCEIVPQEENLLKVASAKTLEEIVQITGRGPIRHRPYWHLYALMARFLETPRDRNFFLLHWILDPHEPYAPRPHFRERIDIDPARLPEKPEFYMRPRLPHSELSEIEQDYVKKLYVAEVESVDERVGFIIDALRYRNLLDDTYIVFTTDHGEMFGEHGKWGHRAYYYDVLMKIPLIITGPDLPKGQRRSALVSLIDLMPTLKDLLGIEYEHDMQGESFYSALFEDHEGKASVYFMNVVKRETKHRLHRDGLLKDDFKLISWDNDELELYNLRNDQEENNNVVAEYPEVAQSMYQKIKLYREENEARKARNKSTTADTLKAPTEEERQKILKELKALGYVQ